MAGKAVLFGISFILSIIGSHARGELTILHSPSSLNFLGSNEVQESFLKEIYSASLGLSVQENSDWNGLVIGNAFNTPEAAVEIYIDGISSLKSSGLKGKTFELITDEYEPDTFINMEHRISQRFSNGDNKIVEVNLRDLEQINHSETFGIVQPVGQTKPLRHLNPNTEEDVQFLRELSNFNGIIQQVKSRVVSSDNAIDFYFFRFQSLHALCDYHGPNSPQAKEALQLLGEAIEEANEAFVKAYEGSVLVTAVVSDVVHTRTRTRRSMGKDLNSGEIKNDSYSADYAAIFNIILWFGVALTFTLVAIVYALMDMDPGRDSIIYRMTNTRMKKDN